MSNICYRQPPISASIRDWFPQTCLCYYDSRCGIEGWRFVDKWRKIHPWATSKLAPCPPWRLTTIALFIDRHWRGGRFPDRLSLLFLLISLRSGGKLRPFVVKRKLCGSVHFNRWSTANPGYLNVFSWFGKLKNAWRRVCHRIAYCFYKI